MCDSRNQAKKYLKAVFGILLVTNSKLSLINYRQQLFCMSKSDFFAYIVDIRTCKETLHLANGAKLLFCKSTYLDQERDLAQESLHRAKEITVDCLSSRHISQREITS